MWSSSPLGAVSKRGYNPRQSPASGGSRRPATALGMRGVDNSVVVIGDSHRRAESHDSSTSTEPNTPTKDNGNCSSGSTAGSRLRAACHSPRHARSHCRQRIQRATVDHAEPTNVAPGAIPRASVVATATSAAMRHTSYDRRIVPSAATPVADTSRNTVRFETQTTRRRRPLALEPSAESRPDAIGLRSRLVGIRGAAFAPRDQRPCGTVTHETRHFPVIHAL